MTRQEFMVKAQKDRYKWAKQVDPKSVELFEQSTQKRYSDGKRK